jgi:hypothetical protein
VPDNSVELPDTPRWDSSIEVETLCHCIALMKRLS